MEFAELIDLVHLGRRRATEHLFKRTLLLRGVNLGPSIRVYGMPIVSMVEHSEIRIGRGSVLTSLSRWTDLGVSRRVILRTLMPSAAITIGEETGLSGTVICATQNVSIGDRCLIGSDVIIMDTNFHPLSPQGRRSAERPLIKDGKVVLEDDVFVGARSIILPGARVGRGTVIGAGSIVRGQIPENSIAVGNPCRVVKTDINIDDSPEYLELKADLKTHD